MSTCGAIIQARMGSSRLPGKVMMPMPCSGGVLVISQVINRLKKATTINKICLATTVKLSDDILAIQGGEDCALVVRGDEKDVLGRYYEAAKVAGYDIIVRIPGDKPCLDPAIVDQVVRYYLECSNVDYVSNFIENTCPAGMEVEVFSFDALKRANKEAKSDWDREHVTTHIYSSNNFKISHYDMGDEYPIEPNFRVTLDTLDDYTLICCIYDYLGSDFTYQDVLQLIKTKPWLLNINSVSE